MNTTTHKRRAWKIVGAIALVLVVAFGVVFLLIGIYDVPKDTTGTPTDQPAAPTKTAIQCVEELPDSVLIGQKLMVAAYNDQLNTVQTIVATKYLNGIIIMEEIPAASVSSLVQANTIKPTIGVDQEGGTVQRYKSEGAVPGAQQVAATQTPEQAYQTYLKDAQFLSSVGITTNFAPVVDVISESPSPLPGRMYSSDPSVVTNYATQMIRASQDAKITPVVKHFPGLGSASGNTDNGPATTDPLSTLQTRDVLPYQSLASFKPDAMVNNATVPGLTNGQPAIWSPEAVSLLRGYGYADSVVYTDSLTAKAIPGSLDQAALKAWQAGIDVAMVVQTKSQTGELDSDTTAIITLGVSSLQSGALTKESVTQSVLRILTRKGIDPCSIKITSDAQ